MQKPTHIHVALHAGAQARYAHSPREARGYTDLRASIIAIVLADL